MFDIMFMRQKWNETALFIWTVPHGLFIGTEFKRQRSVSSLEQMRLLADESRSREH